MTLAALAAPSTGLSNEETRLTLDCYLQTLPGLSPSLSLMLKQEADSEQHRLEACFCAGGRKKKCEFCFPGNTIIGPNLMFVSYSFIYLYEFLTAEVRI